ncbi:hypothetical protein RMATCC62417_09769 [Rhizopus microsporus]|nr:hypothetical protein RMATCC62417_09769 [Rhizopus microsporus]
MPTQLLPNQINIPKFKHLIIYTGNIMRTTTCALKSWNIKSSSELLYAISDTLSTSLNSSNLPYFHYSSQSNTLEIPDIRQTSRIHPDDRDSVEVTAKLFYLKHDDQSLISYIDASIHHLEQLLGVASIDTFVVSFADNESCVEKTWKDLEAYHQDGRIRKLGVSDFDTARLKALYDNPSLTVKPSLNQVNIENCCSNQKELIELGKQYGVEMTFNVDTADILTTESLSDISSKHGVTQEGTTIKPCWVMKYHVFTKRTSVVMDKG